MTQPCSEDTPPTTTTATAAAHGHAEQAVLVHATTHAPEHVWQGAQVDVVVVQVHVLEHAQAVQVHAMVLVQLHAVVAVVAVTAGHTNEKNNP